MRPLKDPVKFPAADLLNLRRRHTEALVRDPGNRFARQAITNIDREINARKETL